MTCFPNGTADAFRQIRNLRTAKHDALPARHARPIDRHVLEPITSVPPMVVSLKF